MYWNGAKLQTNVHEMLLSIVTYNFEGSILGPEVLVEYGVEMDDHYPEDADHGSDQDGIKLEVEEDHRGH